MTLRCCRPILPSVPESFFVSWTTLHLSICPSSLRGTPSERLRSVRSERAEIAHAACLPPKRGSLEMHGILLESSTSQSHSFHNVLQAAWKQRNGQWIILPGIVSYTALLQMAMYDYSARNSTWNRKLHRLALNGDV